MAFKGALAWPTHTNASRWGWLAFWLERLTLAGLVSTILLLGYWYPLTYRWFASSWAIGSQYQLVAAFHLQFQVVILYPSEYAAAATIALWLLARIVASLTHQERAPLRFGPAYITLPLIGLTIITALSATQAILPIFSLEIAAHLLLVTVLVLVVINLRPPLWAVVAPLALLLALEGVLSLVQALTQSTPFSHFLLKWNHGVTAADAGASIVQLPNGARWLRAYGSFPHPNILGGFLCLAGPLFSGAYLRLPRRRSVSGWLLLLALALGLVALLLSFSRAAWLGIAVGTLWASANKFAAKSLRPPSRLCRLHITFHRFTTPSQPAQRVLGPQALSGEFIRPWLRLLLFGALVMGGIVGLVATLGPEIQSRLLLSNSPLEQRSLSERVVLFEAGAIFFSQHPWLGVGAGNMPLVELAYAPTRNIGEPAHNIPVAVAVETGVAGLVLWLIPPLALLWLTWRRRATLSSAGLAASAALMALLTVAQLDHYLWTQPTGLLIWWLALMLTTLWSKRESHAADQG
jgi:O-antigen ligase